MSARCPGCSGPCAVDARFCEGCGADLGRPAALTPAPAAPGPATADISDSPTAEFSGPAQPCPCGGAIAADGYCEQCGSKPIPPRDHLIEDLHPGLASVSDRGVRHHRNEDAAAIAALLDGAALVVCDGVSSSLGSDVASLAAAQAARRVLAQSPASASADPAELSPATLTEGVGLALAQAADAAQAAVLAADLPEHSSSPASCTFVAAVAQAATGGYRITAGCVGDSRAYWVPDSGPAVALTVDDSWAAEQIKAGIPREQAETGPGAHAITRWLGRDAPPHAPALSTLVTTRPGWLVVCSDGLWNYCSDATDLAQVLHSFGTGQALALAQELVGWANRQGGRDNITVALARLDPANLLPLPSSGNGSQ